MDEQRTKDLQDVLSHVGDTWTGHRTEAALRLLPARRARKAAVRAGAGTAALALVAGGAWAFWPGPQPHIATAPAESAPQVAPTPAVSPLPAPTVESLVLADGSRVIAEDVGAAVEVVTGEPRQIEVRVVRGKNRFVVGERKDRAFRVSAGQLAINIDVYASEFSVARYDAHAEVWSHTGVLRIEWEGTVHEVGAGEHAVFPPRAEPADADAVVEPSTDPSAVTAVTARTRAKVEDLLRAADEARVALRPNDAVAPLRRVIDKYPRDPRAPLAAFTLGRVLLDDLGRPRAAAGAFSKARRLAPRGPLAEDSLAREVEAWAAAGNDEQARKRARQYLDRYPRGHRVPAVKQYAEQ